MFCLPLIFNEKNILYVQCQKCNYWRTLNKRGMRYMSMIWSAEVKKFFCFPLIRSENNMCNVHFQLIRNFFCSVIFDLALRIKLWSAYLRVIYG